MQVAITCKHGQLSANQQEYMTRKSEKLLTYFERVTAINVTVTFENGAGPGRNSGRCRTQAQFRRQRSGRRCDSHVRRRHCTRWNSRSGSTKRKSRITTAANCP